MTAGEGGTVTGRVVEVGGVITATAKVGDGVTGGNNSGRLVSTVGVEVKVEISMTGILSDEFPDACGRLQAGKSKRKIMRNEQRRSLDILSPSSRL